MAKVAKAGAAQRRSVGQVAVLTQPWAVCAVSVIPTTEEPVTAVEIFASDTAVTPGSILLVPGAHSASAQRAVLETARAGRAAGVVLDTLEPASGSDPSGKPEQHDGLAVWRRVPGASWTALLEHLQTVLSVPSVADVDTPAELPGIALGDMQRVADGLAALLGGPVIIEDQQLEVISYSSYQGQVDPGRDAAILGRRMPYEWMRYLQNTGDLDALLSQDAVVIDVPNGPLNARRRLLTSVHCEGELVGILWVAEGESPLPHDVSELLVQAAQILLPHLREYHLGRLSQSHQRNQNLRSLFEGATVRDELLLELGLAPATGYVLVAARRADGEPFGGHERSRVMDIMSLYFQAYRWGAASIVIGGTAYCLLAASDRTSEEVIQGAVKGLVKTCAKNLGAQLHIAISGAMPDAHEIPHARSDAERLLASLGRQAYQEGRIMTASQGAIALALDRAADAALAAGANPYRKLAMLEAYDSKRDSNLVESLATFLAHRGNVSAAADRLHLHKTSLRYRLRRIAEISGISLEDPNEYLLCLLLLRDRAK